MQIELVDIGWREFQHFCPPKQENLITEILSSNGVPLLSFKDTEHEILKFYMALLQKPLDLVSSLRILIGFKSQILRMQSLLHLSEVRKSKNKQ